MNTAYILTLVPRPTKKVMASNFIDYLDTNKLNLLCNTVLESTVQIEHPFKSYKYTTNYKMTDIVFEHAAAKALYDNANSQAFADLLVPNEMRDFILPYVQSVIQDQTAYAEASSKWHEFRTVDEQLKTETPMIETLDLNTSICTSLWLYIYH